MISVVQRAFSPAAVGSDETRALFDLPAGSRVLWASCRKNVLAASGTTSTMTLGDGTDPDGYVAAELDLETGAAGDLLNGAGAYLPEGKLYAARGTVDVVYTASGTPGATVPRVTFSLGLVREWAG